MHQGRYPNQYHVLIMTVAVYILQRSIPGVVVADYSLHYTSVLVYSNGHTFLYELIPFFALGTNQLVFSHAQVHHSLSACCALCLLHWQLVQTI